MRYGEGHELSNPATKVAHLEPMAQVSKNKQKNMQFTKLNYFLKGW